ncbi:hypothetical protein [Microbacterium hydrocarbonoxydans]|uniref:hypothetical protein n=1 Tax=Microbacterium hydrocarbonoxydans TaxID=273678 RepID=UPI002040952F|nr:hypothetical protein [Microbacterium hydrocarbonoxydans]MCM3780655.1 hypothetical protein [Microbacterium hydrocarbonoxydans]
MTTTTTVDRDPAITRDAKAWRHTAGVKYTEALRLIEDPLHQGILGDRIVVRDLLRVLEDHPQIGSRHLDSTLGLRGFGASTPLIDELDSNLLRRVILSMEFLRMFGAPSARELAARRTWQGSYLLKHQAEVFLAGTVDGYVSNGTMIWAAASLGLPLRYNDGDLEAPNFDIAIPETELKWLRQGTYRRFGARRGEHFMPPGYARLKAVVDLAVEGEPIDSALAIPLATRKKYSAFHRWLSAQQRRRGDEGRFARDYLAGVEDSDHRPAHSADDLQEIMDTMGYNYEAQLVGRTLLAEWRSSHEA